MMADLHGFAGKILYVNLSTGGITSKRLDSELAKKFIGGMGINSWLIYNLIKPEIEPLSPDNALVFGSGPLVGTLAPTAARVFADSRSPSSGFLSQSCAGHSASIMIKYAGYDHLIVAGRAKKPVYLKISDDEVQICDAEYLWGRDTWETTDLLRKELSGYWIDCIGPAAENLVKYSIILCEKRSSYNKTGPGTIMASKNLKAIAAHGTKEVRVADPKKLVKLSKEITRRIVLDPEIEIYRGPMSFKAAYACPSCPVACKALVGVDEGTYAGLKYRISNYMALATGHNSLAAPESLAEAAKCIEAENRNGIEASTTANMLNYLVKCYENGILKEKEIGFVPKLGGNALRNLIEITVQRKGVGNLMAEGLKKASEEIKRSEQYAVHIKGVGRSHRLDAEISTDTIGSLTNPRGGHGEMSLIPFYNSHAPGISLEELKFFYADLGLHKEVIDRVSKGPDGFNVGRLTKWAEDYTTAYMSLGLCNRPIVMRHMNLEEICELYVAATGLEMQPHQLLFAGERIFNVLKAFNVKCGAARKDDVPPAWDPDKPLVVANKSYGTLNQILDEYYDERGWNVQTGVPTKQKLAALGLRSLADEIYA